MFARRFSPGRWFAPRWFPQSSGGPVRTGGTFRRRRMGRTFDRTGFGGGPIPRAFRRPKLLRAFPRKSLARVLRRPYFRRVYDRGDWMAALMPVTTLPITSGETVRFLFDFTKAPELDAGETISTVSVPAVSGITIGSPTVIATETDGIAAGRGVQVSISGGTLNVIYDVKCLATMSGGSIRAVKGKIQVE